MKSIESAIVRIFSQNKTSVVGVGFLVDGKRVMTCAHVVATAFGIPRDAGVQDLPADRLTLDFPLVDDNHSCTASVVLWLPPQPDETGDIAVLELDQLRPFSTSPAKLVELSEYWDKPFGVYGYPQSEGGWASGVVRGRIAGKRLQIINKDEKSYFIQPGFSGSPVYCDESGVRGVIGMVSSGETDPNLDVGFMIPADVLLKVKDQQNVHHLPSPELAESHAASASGISVASEQSSASPLFSRKFAPRVVYIGKFAEMRRQLKPKNVFVAHPFFGGDAQKLADYRYYLRDGLDTIGYTPLFARDDPGYLLETICRDIIDTEAGIYDVTGYNANVLIELGMSIGLNQPTVVIAQDDNAPLIPPFQQLNPIRYESRIDLTDLIGPAIRERFQAYWQSGMSPRFCASCGLDCIARKPRQSPEAEYLVIGADPQKDKAIFHHLKKAVKNFNLTWQQIEGDFNLIVCQWTEEIKRCKLVFFHSKEGSTRHSGAENAATMVRVGIAVGMGIAWRMILKQGDHMPTDLEGFKYTAWDESPTSFEATLSSAVRRLLGEVRPYGGIYDPLVPIEAFEEEPDDELIVMGQDVNAIPQFRFPELEEGVFQQLAEDVRAVQKLLDNSKVVVIQGIGGSGKTTLVAAVCRDENTLTKYKDGILGFYPRNIHDEASLAEALSNIVVQLNGGTTPIRDLGEAKRSLKIALETRTCLIVVDGLDEISEQFGTIPILSTLDVLRESSSDLLVTSRRAISDLPWAPVSVYTLNPFVGQVYIWFAASDSKETAEEISGKLRELNITVQLIELETLIYADGARQLEAATASGSPFLLLISPEIHKFDGELRLLIAQPVTIMPILVKLTRLPQELAPIQYLDYRVGEQQAFRQLLLALRRRGTSRNANTFSSPHLEKPFVFFSYHHQDKQFIERLHQDLEAQGISTWIDRNNIRAGDDWRERIQEGIATCGAAIVVISQSSRESETIHSDLTAIQDLRKPLIPILIGDHSDVPEDILHLLYADMRGENYATQLRQVTEAARWYLAGNAIQSLPEENFVYLSYTPADNAVSSRLQGDLERNAVRYWSEDYILPGQDWRRVIDHAQQACTVGLVVISNNSRNSTPRSKGLQENIRGFIRLNKPIIPAIIDDFKNLPSALERIQAADLRDYERDFPKLLTELRYRLMVEATQKEEVGSDTKRIFIAYARRDASSISDQLLSYLRRAGFDVFRDFSSIPIGSDFATVIRNEVERCDIILALFSRNALRSEWWVREIAWAMEMGKLVVPILLDDEKMPRPASLPNELRDFSKLGAIAFHKDQADGDIQRLIVQLRNVELPQQGSPLEVALEQVITTLDEEERRRFIQIGAVAPSPSTFDQNALISIWQTDQTSALATIDTFLRLDLIQEVSPNRYQAHELVINFARSLLEAEDESQSRQPKKETSQIRVFINYARADTLELARKMSSALKAQGYDVFYDMDIWDKDANLQIDIQSEVSRSDIVVSLQSPNTFASEWWMKELAWALEMGKLVVPVLVDGYTMPLLDNLPKQISQLAYLSAVTFRSQQFERDFQYLAAQLQKVKSQPISDDRRYVYISGTQRDLPDHRNAIENAILLLAMHSTTFEDFGATAQDALTTSFDMIAESDIYILLLGHRYGYVPDNRRNPEGLSITELEYNEATRLNKPILAFVMDDQHPVSSQSMENDQVSSRKLQAFKRKVMQRHVVELFTTPDDLKAKAIGALIDFRSGATGRKFRQTQQSARKIIHVFASDPSDVKEELSIVRETLDRLSSDPSNNVDLREAPFGTAPINVTPQEAFNQGLPKPSDCDIAIFIFWSRFGTPLPPEYRKPDGRRYLSGTEWEYEDAVQAARATERPITLVYRRAEQPRIDVTSEDASERIEQYKRVEEFFAGFMDPATGKLTGGFNVYDDPSDFTLKFETHLLQVLGTILDNKS